MGWSVRVCVRALTFKPPCRARPRLTDGLPSTRSRFATVRSTMSSMSFERMGRRNPGTCMTDVSSAPAPRLPRRGRAHDQRRHPRGRLVREPVPTMISTTTFHTLWRRRFAALVSGDSRPLPLMHISGYDPEASSMG
jgi:hypothetical protein